jgi:hypothetical protein
MSTKILAHARARVDAWTSLLSHRFSERKAEKKKDKEIDQNVRKLDKSRNSM